MTTRPSIAGQTFSRLTAIRPTQKRKGSHIMWECNCSCGKRGVLVAGDRLKSGNTKSCGCLNMDNVRSLNRSHGMSYSPEYHCWCSMRYRCYNKKLKPYKYYGGRGIRVCSRWLKSFASFYSDMGPVPPGMTLDRINNDKNYCRKNCRWATRAQQTRNRRVRMIGYKMATDIACDCLRGYSNVIISKRYGVGKNIVSTIRRGHSWVDAMREAESIIAKEGAT